MGVWRQKLKRLLNVVDVRDDSFQKRKGKKSIISIPLIPCLKVTGGLSGLSNGGILRFLSLCHRQSVFELDMKVTRLFKLLFMGCNLLET